MIICTWRGQSIFGVRIAPNGPVRDFVAANIAISGKRDLLLSLAIGAVVELGLWYYLNFMAEDVIGTLGFAELSRLQEPGIAVGVAIYRHLFLHAGKSLSLDLAIFWCFVVLTGCWTAVSFTLLSPLRLTRR